MSVPGVSSSFLKARKLGVVRQLKATAVLSLSLTIFGNMLAWPSPILNEMDRSGQPFNLTVSERSWMVSLLYMGNCLSPFPLGYFMDWLGRKTVLLALSIIPLSSWILTLYAKESIQLSAARFLCGVWAAGVTTITPLYLAEIAEPRLRGKLSVFSQISINIGILIVYVVGSFVSFEPLTAICGIFPLMFMAFFWLMPESPYWLSMQDDDAAAAVSLSWLRGENLQARRVTDEIKELSLGVHEEMQHPRNFRDLISTKGHRRALLIVEVLAIAQRFSGISAIIAYLSTTLPQRNIGIFTPNHCVIILSVIWTLSAWIAFYLLDSWGRKPLMLISCAGSCVSTLIFGLYYFLEKVMQMNMVEEYYWWPLATMISYSVFYNIGLGPVPVTLQGEMFAANTKALASACTATVFALSSFISNYLYLRIEQIFGMYVNFWGFSFTLFISALFTHYEVIETRGKTLHEVHEDLENTPSLLNAFRRNT